MPKPYEWKREQARLWDELVPESGRADTLQGELIRMVGKLTDEAFRNGNLNWDDEMADMWRFVGQQLDDPQTFSAVQLAEINGAVDSITRDPSRPDLRRESNPFYLVGERAVDWCMTHPELIARPATPTFRR